MKKTAKAKKTTKAKQAAKPKASPYYAQSKRLGFRLINAADEALYCDLYTDADTLKYVCPPLSRERAVASFIKAVEVTSEPRLNQRISVIVERATKKPIGLASIKLTDATQCRAEGGLLLKPTAHAQRFANESSLALISVAFRRNTIAELNARVALEHKAGVKLVIGSGYTFVENLPPIPGRSPRGLWTMTREYWAEHFK